MEKANGIILTDKQAKKSPGYGAFSKFKFYFFISVNSLNNFVSQLFAPQHPPDQLSVRL